MPMSELACHIKCVSGQSIIKVWLVERIKSEAANNKVDSDTGSGVH